MGKCSFLGILMIISLSSFAKEKKMKKAEDIKKVKVYPCDVIRENKHPLPGRECAENQNGKIVVTTCVNTKCLAKVGSVRSRDTSSCDDNSPTTPGYVSIDSFNQTLKAYVLSLAEDNSFQVGVGNTDSISLLSKDQSIIYLKAKTNGEQYSLDSSRVLNSLNTIDATLLKEKFAKSERRPVVVYAVQGSVNNEPVVAPFKFTQNGDWVRASVVEAIEDCK